MSGYTTATKNHLMRLFCSTSNRRMENKAMYLHTFSERENGSTFEEPFEGRNVSKLNLCEDGESRLHVWLDVGGGFEPGELLRGTWKLGLLRKQLGNLVLPRQRCLG